MAACRRLQLSLCGTFRPLLDVRLANRAEEVDARGPGHVQCCRVRCALSVGGRGGDLARTTGLHPNVGRCVRARRSTVGVVGRACDARDGLVTFDSDDSSPLGPWWEETSEGVIVMSFFFRATTRCAVAVGREFSRSERPAWGVVRRGRVLAFLIPLVGANLLELHHDLSTRVFHDGSHVPRLVRGTSSGRLAWLVREDVVEPWHRCSRCRGSFGGCCPRSRWTIGRGPSLGSRSPGGASCTERWTRCCCSCSRLPSLTCCWDEAHRRRLRFAGLALLSQW